MFYEGYENIVKDFVLNTPEYADALPARPMVRALAASDDDTPSPTDPGTQIKKYFTFNQTGNIMVSSTTPDEAAMDPDVKKVFQKVIVFFGAITAAMSQKGKTLYDYAAMQEVIGKSGLFIAMHQEDRNFSYSSHELTLDTAIISGILGSVSGVGGAMAIAQQVLSNIGSTIQVSAESTSSDKRVGHLLFVCENLMGMPIVTIQLFNVDAKECETVAKSNCSTYVSTSVDFKYHQDTYMFVDPEYITQFTDEFQENPDYKKLIDKLSQTISG
jgi:hypothetical protein